jgi:hypothetical protein
LRDKSNPLFQQISLPIQQIEFGLVNETKRALELARVGVICIQVREPDFAKVLRFEPMDHGRHGTAGASGEAEKLDQL